MAELPEVETIRRQLSAEIAGAAWENVRARPCSVFRSPAALVARSLTGARVCSADRKGKVLILNFDNGWSLLVHLGMSGQVLLRPPAEPGPAHRHLEAELSDGRTLVFRDPRRFGFIKVVRTGEMEKQKEVAGVGADPLSPVFTWEKFVSALKENRASAKAFLLNQQLFCGLGNIYADEVLFTARVAPGRRTGDLSVVEMKDLFHAVRTVLSSAIECGGTSFDAAFVDVFGRPGLYGGRLKVYGREKEKCVTCHTALRLLKVSGRSSVFCPHCQK